MESPWRHTEVSQLAWRVYYPPHSHLYADDVIPPYLIWIIETADGQLYSVPAEVDGWHQRMLYKGRREDLVLVSPHERNTILHCVHANSALLTAHGHFYE
jgi:hypothetical protein